MAQCVRKKTSFKSEFPSQYLLDIILKRILENSKKEFLNAIIN